MAKADESSLAPMTIQVSASPGMVILDGNEWRMTVDAATAIDLASALVDAADTAKMMEGRYGKA